MWWWWWGVRAFNCVTLLYFSDTSAQAKTSSSSQKPAFNLLLLHGNCIKQSFPAKLAFSHYLDQTQHHRKSTQYITPVTVFSFKPEGVITYTFSPSLRFPLSFILRRIAHSSADALVHWRPALNSADCWLNPFPYLYPSSVRCLLKSNIPVWLTNKRHRALKENLKGRSWFKGALLSHYYIYLFCNYPAVFSGKKENTKEEKMAEFFLSTSIIQYF